MFANNIIYLNSLQTILIKEIYIKDTIYLESMIIHLKAFFSNQCQLQIRTRILCKFIWKEQYKVRGNCFQIRAVYVCFSVMTKTKTKTKQELKKTKTQLKLKIWNKEICGDRSKPTVELKLIHSAELGVQTESSGKPEDSWNAPERVRFWAGGLGLGTWALGFWSEWDKLTHCHAPGPENVILTTFRLFIALLPASPVLLYARSLRRNIVHLLIHNHLCCRAAATWEPATWMGMGIADWRWAMGDWGPHGQLLCFVLGFPCVFSPIKKWSSKLVIDMRWELLSALGRACGLLSSLVDVFFGSGSGKSNPS